MSRKVKIGAIGMGQRGSMLLKDVLTKLDVMQVVAVCDEYEDRAQAAKECVLAENGFEPFCTTDYREVIHHPEVEAVLVLSAWESHINIAVECMKAGKRVGMEVGGAYSVDDCWRLVRTSEETGVPCMLLENCCYGRKEMMVMNMVKLGLFGEIVHCSGGYCHDLRNEIAFGKEIRHYRLRNYLNRNCENYPTHELGPIAQILGINRGNRMVSLVSVASCAKGLKEYIRNNPEADKSLLDKTVAQGDVVTTTIKCVHGQTIVLKLDTTLPRGYSRGFTVQGTKGMYQEDTDSVFLDGVHNEFHENWKPQWGNAEKYREEYDHPLWKQYLADGVMAGHGGMDGLVMKAFADSVIDQTEPPIDVYDTAAWMCISALSEESIATGNTVAVPDFTNGMWLRRK